MPVTSTDAIQWTLVDSGTTANLSRLASGNGVFIATGVPDTMLRSTDGINWQPAGWQVPAAIAKGVAFANGQFLLLAREAGYGPMLNQRPSSTRAVVDVVGAGGGT